MTSDRCPECGTPLDEVPLRECATHRASEVKPATGKLLIMEQIAPEPNPGNRFRIVEVFVTVDGMRSRLTNNSFSSIEEARFFVSTHGG